MGLSVGSIGSLYSASYVQPMNYSVKNEADVSDAFNENGMQGMVQNVAPVIYPNAQEIAGATDEKDPLQLSMNTVQKSQEANRMYNEVAQRFGGMTVGYGQDMGGMTYGTTGATLDLFA